MSRFNSDIVFIDTSGQVRSRFGSLTLRGDDSGLADIIVGSGASLRPETDCQGPLPIDLGRDYLRWNTLYACSGNFLERPTVNGSGVALEGNVVNTINGLFGPITIASGVSNLIEVSVSGTQGIILDLDPERLEDNLTLSGISKLENADSEAFQSTTSTTFVEVLSLSVSVPSSGIYRAQWSFQGSASQANKRCEYRIQLDDSALVSDLMSIDTSFNVANGPLQFGGFAQFGLDAGLHTVDFDFRKADTGGAATQVENLRLELLKVS